MSDMDKSFTFLQNSIPQWLQDIAGIEKKVVAMQEEIANVPISQSPFAKGKTGSTDSIRPEKLDAIAEDAPTPDEALTNPLGSRKRKTPSVSSGRVSGPSRYRPKTMVVVSYDGDMQKSLELLVRALGSGRNMLRKAKMEAKMKELAALAGSSDDEDDAGDDDNEHDSTKMSYRPRLTSMRLRAAARRGGMTSPSSGATPSVELFEATDKTLEQAQELCEKSAHLSLREGDCRTELGTVRKHLEDVLLTAKNEVVKATTNKSQTTPPQEAPDTPGTSVSSTEPSYKRHFPSLLATAPAPESTPRPLLSHPSMPGAALDPKTMEIEVDDNSDEEEDLNFVMPAVRFTSRRAIRA
jgi:hypothetical protein